MTARLVLFGSVLSMVLAPLGHPQDLGTPPAAVSVTNLYTAFRLPPLQDNTALASALTTTQVGKRAVMLGLNGNSALDGWTAAATATATRIIDRRQLSGAVQLMTFNGVLASDLNKLLAGGSVSVTVTSPMLKVDQPIEVTKSGVILNFASAVVISGSSAPYMVRIEGTSHVTVRGGNFTSGKAGMLVNNAQDVRVEGVALNHLSSHGIVVTGSTNVVLTGNQIQAVSGAPILVHRGTAFSTVEHNTIASNLGPSNVTAGIVISDREVDLASNPLAIFGPDGYWVVSQPITARLHPPHDNLIAYNTLTQNASSGVYVDGGVRNAIVSNTMEGNSKEGLCLDNGSTANVVASNVIEQNGDRWGEPDSVLQLDSVLSGGRLPDGTGAAKVPGISIDNAMYNIVYANTVSHNYGGGIKIVRTGYFNLIGMNTIYSDNDGANPSFHFFGIELGATPGDTTAIDLDFTPSRGNEVFSNPIRGTHYSGIFFDVGSDLNDVFDNTILDATSWALESVAVMNNLSLNNLTNVPSRNIGSGLDPALLTIGLPVLDGSVQ